MLKLILITNNPNVVKIVDGCGVNFIMIDLEQRGKQERQKGWNSVFSNHSILDIKRVKEATTNSEVLVRINSIYEGSKEEIDSVIEAGADVVMLPFFKTVDEVKFFLDCVGGRAKTSLLFETKEAVGCIDDVLGLEGIDMVHIGLNDLSHSYDVEFLFGMISNGVVDSIVSKFRQHGITNYGIGGIARIGSGDVPSEDIIAEHYRLGSTSTILSRSFCNMAELGDAEEIKNFFDREIGKIRRLESIVDQFDDDIFEMCHKRFNDKVNAVIEKIKDRK